MRKLPRLYVVMLRYRIAAMVVMFMLLGAAGEGRVVLGVRYLWAVLVLASSYVSATALNDLVDEPIDRVNHPRDAGRPLVEGTATRSDLWLLHAVAAGLTVLAAIPLGSRGLVLAAVSLAVSHAYSAGPLRLSYRIACAPALLGVAYVVVPYALGVVAAGGPLAHVLARRSVALYLLFLARIVLKDFRDREGDARYGKSTLLLRFGKTPTCGVSLIALLAADAVLAASFAAPLAIIAQPFVAAIALLLARLWRAEDGRAEQVAIGVGARIGNGLLLGALAWLLLAAHGAPPTEAVTFEAVLAVLFLGSSALLALRPQDAVLGYKG